jgi:hypothetical protein
MPVFFSNIGRIKSNNPEFWVLVVDAQRMRVSAAAGAVTATNRLKQTISIATIPLNNLIYPPPLS